MGLALVGDHAALHQVDGAVADHAGVQAQVLAVFERLDQRLRYSADADAQCIAVLDALADHIGHFLLLSADVRVGPRLHRPIHFYDVVELADVHERIAVGVRHALVHLRDGHLGMLGGIAVEAGHAAEADVAFLVRRRYVHQRHIERHRCREQFWRLRQCDGKEVYDAFLHGLPVIGVDMHRYDMKVIGQFCVRRARYHAAVEYMRSLEPDVVGGQGIDERARLPAGALDENHIAGLDGPDRFFRSYRAVRLSPHFPLPSIRLLCIFSCASSPSARRKRWSYIRRGALYPAAWRILSCG